MNIEERMASLKNKLNDRLSKVNAADNSASVSFNANAFAMPQMM